MSDLGTIGINISLQGQKETVSGLTQAANVLDNKVSPSAKRVIENFKQTRQMIGLVNSQTESLSRTFTTLELERVAQRMGSLQNVLNNTRQGMNGFGVITQQAGYQIGDFIVQVQSGTSAFVAFGQQATQMVGFLPLLASELNITKVAFMGLNISMATVTLGLSIIIPLLTAAGAVWMRTSEDVKKAKDGVNDFVSSLKDAEGYVKNASGSVEDLQDRYGKFGEQMRDLSKFLAEVSVSRAFEALNTESSLFLTNIDETASNIARLQSDISSVDFSKFEEGSSNLQIARENVAGLEESIVQMSSSLGLSAEQVLALNSAFDNVQRQTTMEGVAQAAFDALKTVEGMNFEAGKLPPELAKAVEQMEKVLAAASRFSGLDLTSGISAAASSAARLAEELGISVGLASKLIGMGKGTKKEVIFDPRDPNYNPIAAEAARIRENAGTVSPFDPSRQPKDKKTGGGGPSKTTIENKLEEVYRYLELDKYLVEQENIAFEQRQDVLKSALDKKLITLEEYNQLEKDLMTQHAYDLANIENKAQMNKLSTVLGSGAQILQAVGAHNEKAAKMARVFGAAQALADTYAGAAAALKLPFPANLAAASSIVAAGLGFVNAIKSGSSSARPSGGGVGSATVAPTASAPAPQTVFIDNISPESLYSGETLINLFEAFYDENDKRGKVFMVAR